MFWQRIVHCISIEVNFSSGFSSQVNLFILSSKPILLFLLFGDHLHIFIVYFLIQSNIQGVWCFSSENERKIRKKLLVLGLTVFCIGLVVSSFIILPEFFPSEIIILIGLTIDFYFTFWRRDERYYQINAYLKNWEIKLWRILTNAKMLMNFWRLWRRLGRMW